MCLDLLGYLSVQSKVRDLSRNDYFLIHVKIKWSKLLHIHFIALLLLYDNYCLICVYQRNFQRNTKLTLKEHIIELSINPPELWNIATNFPDHIAVTVFLLLRFETWHPWIKSIIGRSWGFGQIDGWTDAHNRVTWLEPFELLQEKQSWWRDSDFIELVTQPTPQYNEIERDSPLDCHNLVVYVRSNRPIFQKWNIWETRGWWWCINLIFCFKMCLECINHHRTHILGTFRIRCMELPLVSPNTIMPSCHNTTKHFHRIHSVPE